MENLFKSIITTSTFSWKSFLIVCIVSYILGIILALGCKFRSKYSKSFLVTISIIPSVVALIIIMVNGSLGAGIAIAGAFGLVRFRSAPGSAKEITAIFASTAVGIVMGMGYIAYAVIFCILTITVIMLLSNIPIFGSTRNDKMLEITIPENLNYYDEITPVIEKYTDKVELQRTKLVNLGSMYRLKYRIHLKKGIDEKKLLDEIRCLNGNLDIMLGSIDENREEL